MNSEQIWAIVSTVAAGIFAVIAPIIKMKASKYLTLLDMIIKAFDDGDITKEEFTAIVSYAKSVLKK